VLVQNLVSISLTLAVFSEYSFGNVFSGLATAAKLLGCTANQLVTAMSTRKIRAGNDNIVKKLTLTQVCNYLIFNGFFFAYWPLGFLFNFLIYLGH
jgi:hypothetical protein